MFRSGALKPTIGSIIKDYFFETPKNVVYNFSTLLKKWNFIVVYFTLLQSITIDLLLCVILRGDLFYTVIIAIVKL